MDCFGKTSDYNNIRSCHSSILCLQITKLGTDFDETFKTRLTREKEKEKKA